MKCGCKLHNNIQVPANANILISPSGREYYVTGIDEDKMIIKYVDGKQPEYVKVAYQSTFIK